MIIQIIENDFFKTPQKANYNQEIHSSKMAIVSSKFRLSEDGYF